MYIPVSKFQMAILPPLHPEANKEKNFEYVKQLISKSLSVSKSL